MLAPGEVVTHLASPEEFHDMEVLGRHMSGWFACRTPDGPLLFHCSYLIPAGLDAHEQLVLRAQRRRALARGELIT